MELAIPQEIQTALDNGAALVLSVSGGKDSDAMTYALLAEYERQQWQGEVVLVHADLGRMERSETPDYVETLAKRTGVELVVVRHPKYDLLGGIQARYDKLKSQGRNQPPFPSSAARYCTSDYKRAPISKWIRNRWVQDQTVIVAMGLRAEESHARAKKPIVRERPSSCAPTKGRMVYDWLPILHWHHSDVWQIIDDNSDVYHPAYDEGNERLSCGMCVLACGSDIRNGAYNRPDTYQALVDLELDSGFTFQQGKPLYAIAPELLRLDQQEAIAQMDIPVQLQFDFEE